MGVNVKAYINAGNCRKGIPALVFPQSFNYSTKNSIKRVDRKPHQSKERRLHEAFFMD
jgi:hypothetical protein